jgi:hypothetical protein
MGLRELSPNENDSRLEEGTEKSVISVCDTKRDFFAPFLHLVNTPYEDLKKRALE